MADITITVQSLLNNSVYDEYTVADSDTVSAFKSAIYSAQGFDPSWFELYYAGQVLNTANTLASYGIATGDAIRVSNVIGRLSTKEYRQKAKLALASLDRDASGNSRSSYDLTQLPAQYNDNDVIDNPNVGGLDIGRPWIASIGPFTFYEAFGTTVEISTTQYVSGNKIYAESSTYDVPDFQPARVVVNDIEIVNTELRGHTLAVLDSYGDTVSITNFDTFGDAGTLATLASALNSVVSGNIVILVVYDASALDAGVRTAINTGYGSTNLNTWVSTRNSHIFIGEKG